MKQWSQLETENNEGKHGRRVWADRMMLWKKERKGDEERFVGSFTHSDKLVVFQLDDVSHLDIHPFLTVQSANRKQACE